MSRTVAAAALVAALAACKTAPPRPAAGPSAPPPPIDEAALDRSVSPCEDFYRFACGGWIASTEIPADQPAWSRGFMEVRERNQYELRGLADAAAAGKLDPADRFAGKVGDYWASCMDEAGVEARGLSDLREEWTRIDAVQDRGELADELARLAAAGIEAPFMLDSGQDARDAVQTIGILAQGGLSLPDRDYYLKADEKSAAIRTSWQAYVEKMLSLAGEAPAAARADAAAIAGLERTLAESHWTRVEMREPTRIYNRVDRPGLERLAPSFPWRRWFDGLGHPDVIAVSVTTPRFVEQAGKLLESAPLETWRAYLRWRMLRDAAGARALPRAFVDAAFAFASENFTGAKEQEPRWKKCVSETDEALGQALGQAYVRKTFGPDGKVRTTRLVAEIERAMDRDLDALPWMDDPTRTQAKQKLAQVVNQVGYPDVWRDYSAMELTRGSYFQNLLSAARFEVNRKLDKIGKPVDKNDWEMSPPAVNAYYEPPLNEMVFPAGILQPPFFNKAAPEVVNYGSIGMVVGHELTHGFDDEGRQYDAGGNLRDWWSPQVAKEFDARARCIVEQYDGFEAVPGVKVNGQLTLGENIADLGGLKLAWAAMQAEQAGKPRPEKLAGFTADQQFFVGYAQAWCYKVREPFARMLAAIDPHAPPPFRVNGPLANLPQFANAFGCRAGTPMARPPQQRCAIW